MSKKVTAVTDSVTLPGGEDVFLCSDGCVKHGCVKKGDDVTEGWDVAVTPRGMVAIKQALPLIKQAAEIKKKLEALGNKTQRGSLGALRFIGGGEGSDDGHEEPGVGVGCTFIEAEELPAVLKKLGIKL